MDLVNSVIISSDLAQIVNFSARMPDCDSHSFALLDLFLLMLVFVLKRPSLHWEILIMLLSQFPFSFHHIHNGMPHFIALLITILVVIGMVFVIIWEMLHGRISLNSVLLLLVGNCLRGFKFELMYISLIESIRSLLTHLHDFQLLVLLPYFKEITFFVCTKTINLLNLNLSSDMLVIIAKGWLKLPNLYMPVKQKGPSLPRNMALKTFGELRIIFSTKVNLLYLLYSTAQRCCLLHPIKQKWLPENFSKNSDLDDSGVSSCFSLLELIWNRIIFLELPRWLERSKWTLICQRHLVLILLVLKNCEPELSYIPSELFNKCLKEAFWRRSRAKNYYPVSLLSVVSNVLEKLLSNRMIII